MTQLHLNEGLSELKSSVQAEAADDDRLGQSLKRYELLEDAMLQAGDKHIITPLPVSEPSSKDEYAHSRLKTIRKRLFMLGYLERDSGQANLGPMLKNAIIAFQEEAFGAITLKADGWVRRAGTHFRSW